MTKIASMDLLDGDLLDGGRSGLGNHDRQDAVLQAGLDIVPVDAARESEGTLELADGALAGPEVVAGLGLGGVITSGLLGLGGVVLALGAALYDQSVGIGELDVDVLLGDAGQLAIQVVGVLGLANVEARGEGAGGDLAAGTVVVVVVQEAEERGEVARREVGAQQRHCV